MSLATQAKASLAGRRAPQPMQSSPIFKVAQKVTGAQMPGASAPAPTPQAPTMRPAPSGPAQPTPQTPQTALPFPPVAPAPVPPVGGVPPVQGAAVNKIDPANDLRFSAITPDNAGAPNRTALAQAKFRDLMAGQADEHRLGVEQIGRDAAKFGRIGMGGVATSVGNLADVFKRRELEAANSLASSVADGDIADRTNQRNELRGERDYQYGVGRDTQDDRVRQKLLEEQLLNGSFGRAATATSLGYQGNPSGTQAAIGQSYGDDANAAFDDIGELMRQLAARRAQQPKTPTSTVKAPVLDNGY